MPRSEFLARPNTELLQRAAAAWVSSARIIARSAELIMRSVEIMQSAGRIWERTGIVRTQTLRARIAAIRRAEKQRAAGQVHRARPMPLRLHSLLEMADEISILSTRAATPEGRAAFEDLAFRYKALAAGCDVERIGGRTLH